MPVATPRERGSATRLQGGLASLNVARGPREIASRPFRRVQSSPEISVIRRNDFPRCWPPPSSSKQPAKIKCMGEKKAKDDVSRLQAILEKMHQSGKDGKRRREMERTTRHHATVNKVINGDRVN